MQEYFGELSTGLMANVEKDKERELAKTDLIHLGRAGLGYEDLDVCHDELWQWLDKEWDEEWKARQFFLILMARGHLKSSLITIGKSIQEILKKPDIRILIVNAVWERARDFLASITEHLNKTYFKENFNITLRKETQEQIVVSIRRKKDLKEPTVDTTGVEKTKTGMHYDLIILDDVVDETNITTKEQIEKVVDCYKRSLNLLEPTGKIIVIGTIWHYADLYRRIIDEPEGLGSKFKVYTQAVIKNGTVKEREVDDKVQYYLTKDSEISFPKKFNEDLILQLRRQSGHYEFFTQYMNEAVASDYATFNKDLIRYWKEEDIKGQSTNVFITIDPAISETKHGDFTGICINLVAPDGKWRIIGQQLKTNDPDKIIDKIFWLNKFYNRDNYRVIKVGIEVVQYQKALAHYIKKRQIETSEFIPLVELKTDTSTNKEMRIKGLQPYYEQHQILFRREDDALIKELWDFPRSKFDDILDATAYQIQLDPFGSTVNQVKKVNPNSLNAIHEWAVGKLKSKDIIGNEYAEDEVYSPYG